MVIGMTLSGPVGLYATSEWRWNSQRRLADVPAKTAVQEMVHGEGFPHHPDLAGHQGQKSPPVEAISSWNNVLVRAEVARLPDPKLHHSGPICAPPPGAATDTRQRPGSVVKASDLLQYSFLDGCSLTVRPMPSPPATHCDRSRQSPQAAAGNRKAFI